jgi:hypothetical protein
VIQGTARVVAQIEDASALGMRLRGPLTAAVDSKITVQALGSVVEANVRWCKDGCLGVEFRGDRSNGDLGRFITRLMRAPLRKGGARLHGFTELAAPRPALPAAPRLTTSPPAAPPQPGPDGARAGPAVDGPARWPGSG